MKKKQTAVSMLIETLTPFIGLHQKRIEELAKKYIDIEREQIEEAWICGALDTNAYQDFAEQYYTQTFKP